MKLLRSGVKGNFVLWPKGWGKRWLSPEGRRFQTGCDMLVGGCSCGRHHRADDSMTLDYLSSNNASIETWDEWRERTRPERISEANASL